MKDSLLNLHEKYFPELLNKIEEICEILMIFKNLLEISLWLKNLFDHVPAYCIESVE